LLRILYFFILSFLSPLPITKWFLILKPFFWSTYIKHFWFNIYYNYNKKFNGSNILYYYICIGSWYYYCSDWAIETYRKYVHCIISYNITTQVINILIQYAIMDIWAFLNCYINICVIKRLHNFLGSMIVYLLCRYCIVPYFVPLSELPRQA